MKVPHKTSNLYIYVYLEYICLIPSQKYLITLIDTIT